MIKDYLLVSAKVDALEFTDDDKSQARALGGELSAPLTDDRLKVMIGAANATEHYCSAAFWRGALGSARHSSVIVEVYGGEVPIAASLPDSDGVITITSVKRWSDSADAFEDAPYKLRPSGRIRLEDAGVYEVRAMLLPNSPAPSAAVEGFGRIYAYQSSFRPGVSTLSELGAVTPPRLSGSIIRSGAGELLQGLRKVRA